MSNSELDILATTWRGLDPKNKLDILETLDPTLQKAIATEWRFTARPEQYLPKTDEDWFLWLFLGGYGAGKTWTGSHFVAHFIKQGYKAPALVGQTTHDVRNTMVEGPSGVLQALDSAGIKHRYLPSQRRIYLPDLGENVYMVTYSADSPDQFKGPEHDIIWMDEQCKWSYPEAYEYLLTRARHGEKPILFSSTTPERSLILDKQIPYMINARVEGSEVVVYDCKVNENPEAYIWVSQSKTSDNLALNSREQNVWGAMYGNTRNKEWALEGRILLDVPDALWTSKSIEKNRIDVPKHHRTEELLEELQIERVVVAVDPAVTTGEKSDESGIMVVGLDTSGYGYVLEDASGKLGPVECATCAINLYNKWLADAIIYERNQGGDFVKETFRMVDPKVPIKDVWASKGKRTRAEPIVAIYEQDKIKHVGEFPLLESQMLAFTPDNRVIKSPDRVDALVWGFTELLLQPTFDGEILWI